MGRLLAIDWDRREARFVLANVVGEQISVRRLAAVPLTEVLEDGDPQPDLGNSLRAALSELRPGRATTLVTLDRSGIEIMQLSLPPAKAEELPVLVANEALRESQMMAEDSVLDFVPLGDDPGEPRHVLAAAVSPEQHARVQQVCAVAGIKPARLVLRPLAAASLLARMESPPGPPTLLVNVVGDEVDMTLLVEGRAWLTRTIRLPANADIHRALHRLLGELNRTIMVAAQGTTGADVERVVLFGSAAEHVEVASRIEAETSLPTMVVDPFEAVEADDSIVPEERGRFAALLGVLLDEAYGRAHAIDFANPRREPPPPNRWRMAAVVGALLLLVLGAGYLHVRSELAELERTNAELREHRDKLAAYEEQTRRVRHVYAAINAWEGQQIVWLDELRDLAIRLPPSRDMVVSGRLSLAGRGSGEVRFPGIVRDYRVISRMEQRLRDGFRTVDSRRVQERDREQDYNWHFETTIRLQPRHPSQYTSHLPAAPAEARAEADAEAAETAVAAAAGEDVSRH